MRVQGSISGTSLDEITVDFNSTGISDGTYNANINVASNDPVTPSIDIAVSLTVQTPEITVSPISFDYGYIEVGTTSTKQFTIQNSGNALLEGYITTLSSFAVALASDGDNQRLEAENDPEQNSDNRATVYYSVVAGETNTYNLSFTPVAVADYSGTITVSDNCPENDFSITVSAHGDEPDVDITPTAVDVTLANFETTSQTLTIENTSNIEVTYEASLYEEKVYPDRESLWTGSVQYSNFIDPSLVNGYSTIDGWMMFNISSIPDNAIISEIVFNGYVNSGNAPYWSITPVTMYPLNGPQGGAFHNDIYNGANNPATCYHYEAQDPTFAIGWRSYTLSGTANADLQSALSQDWFVTGICNYTNSTTYFIIFDGWNQTNKPYLTVSYTLPNDLDTWLTIDSDTSVSGTIPAVDDVTHTIGFDPSLVGDGTYSTDIRISSNDTDEPEILVPVTLTVETPVINYTPSSFAFGDILVGEISTDQFTIENTGTATLSGSITTPSGYSVTLAGVDNSNFGKKLESINTDNRNVLTFDIDPGVTLTYDLTFAPTAVADYNGNVAISHNALGGSDNITVTGSGVEPNIDVSPTSFAVTIQEHEIDSETLTISNLGGYPLTFSGSVDYGLDIGSKKEMASDDIDSWLSLDGSVTTSGTVSAGGSTPVTLGFDPTGLADGSYTAYVNISSDDPDESTVSVQVDMTVSTAGIAALPGSIDFGDILVNQSSTDQFTIENTGNASLTGSITTPDGYSVILAGGGDFTSRVIDQDRNPNNKDSRNVLSYSINAGVIETFDLTFTPDATGVFSGSISISNNAGGGDETISVTGTGVTIILGINPGSFNESVYSGDTVTTSLTVSNTGTASLTYDGQINYDGSEDPWLTLDGQQTLGGTVSASGSYEYNVLFDSDGLSPDTYTATISGTSNDPDNPTFSISVSFTIVQPVSAPINVDVEVSGSAVTVSWDAVTGATLYHVYSSSSPDGSFSEESGGSFSSGTRESWTKTYSPIPDKVYLHLHRQHRAKNLPPGCRPRKR